ncbi:MAG: glutamate-1-semialdehyde 2,1-aminomutase [Thaumarchaeota archaeon]|nr:glutamate-1-semialdehyde 2,1-aminomutase [Nitrososphaerota archaeon]
MLQNEVVRKTTRSEALHAEARKVIPSGSSSLIRVVGFSPSPIYIERAKGSHMWDADGNEYTDLLMAFGVLINGHCHPRIVEALKSQAESLMISGTPTEMEFEMAKKVTGMVPNAQMALFCNSGTEATMHAIRMARAVTGKDRIVKFEGAYHGQHDYVMFSVEPSEPGLEIRPYIVPYDPGIPEEISRTVAVAPWNNPQTLEKIIKRYRNDIAAIITEPILANCGVILPQRDYLKQLKEIAEKYEALLIFDEVVTGFRIAEGGAQELYGVNADLAVFGKALGGGVPIAAITGRKDILELVAPGKILFGGTYNANSLTLAGASANLDLLSENGGAAYPELDRRGRRLMKGLNDQARAANQDVIVQGVGAVFQVFFTRLKEITNYREALLTNDERFKAFHEEMMKRGVYIHPDPFERICISTAHTDEDIDRIIEISGEAFREVHSQFD